MQQNICRLSILTTVVVLFFNWGCTKIDTTTLGSELIPAVDNVKTFADTLEITTSQAIFDDTVRMGYSELHPIGAITNDPVFGKTKADLYVELKPGFFPFYFGNTKDTILGFDSAMLCLSFNSIWGDTTQPHTFTVYEINDATTNFKDSAYKLDFLPNQGLGPMIGSVTIMPTDVRRYTYFKGSVKDSVTNQIRIPLNNSFLQTTLTSNLDTTSGSSGIYRSDSLFKDRLKGFAIIASGATTNSLMYVNLTDAATRLEVHFRKTNRGIIDTSYSRFSFSTGLTSTFSAQATHLTRDRVGYPVSSPSSDVVHIQTTPGTYAILNIPGLSNYDNRIIHRAEIFMEQVLPLDPVAGSLQPPLYLYMDLLDTPTLAGKYKPIYFDLNPSTNYYPDDSTYFYPSGGIDFSYFGGVIRKKSTGSVSNYYYTFNVSRHVQHIVTNHQFNYPFRLYSPSRLFYGKYLLSFNNILAEGRVVLGSGTHPTQKMYMRVVYSKI